MGRGRKSRGLLRGTGWYSMVDEFRTLKAKRGGIGRRRSAAEDDEDSEAVKALNMCTQPAAMAQAANRYDLGPRLPALPPFAGPAEEDCTVTLMAITKEGFQDAVRSASPVKGSRIGSLRPGWVVVITCSW